MFSWLKRLFSFLRGGEDIGVYRPRERKIYAFHNGQKMIKADPLVLYKRFSELAPELAVDVNLSRSAAVDNKTNIEGHNASVAKVREIFGVLPLDQGGLTEAECGDLLDHFLEYCDSVKKNMSPSQTSSTPSAPAAPASPTPPGSASGSTASAPSTAEPQPSPTGPP